MWYSGYFYIDLRSTWGLKKYKNYKAKEDSDAAAQYRLAGAIPVVVTNIPTMCIWWDTSNPAFGRTKNPYDNKRSPGGSSGIGFISDTTLYWLNRSATT